MTGHRPVLLGLRSAALLAPMLLFTPSSATQTMPPSEETGGVAFQALSEPAAKLSASEVVADLSLSAGVSAAEDAPAEPVANFAAKMSSVERVYIRVPGMASLSGEYRLSGDGTIALPGLGRLQVGEATIEAFEAQLAAEIERVSNRESSVAVEVIDYRPIFVSGLVARSGSFPWKPGFSVLHAEALAGGLFRGTVAADGSMAAAPSRNNERERAVRATYELAATLATIERLKKEASNETHYVLPNRVAALVSKLEQESLLSAQQAMLKSRLSLHNAKVAAAENAKKIAAGELKALDEQLVRIREQLIKRRATVKKVEYMTSNRYARGDRLFEEEVKVAELEERLTTTTLARTRTEMTISSAEQQLEAIILGRKAEHDTEFLALAQKKAELEIAINSANENYRSATGQDAVSSASSEPLVTRYEIVRMEGGFSKVLRADRSTPVQPGDVIVVSVGRLQASSSNPVPDNKAELHLAP